MIYSYIIDMYNDANYYAVSIESQKVKTEIDKLLSNMFSTILYVGCKDKASYKETGNRKIADDVYIKKCRLIWNGNKSMPISMRNASKVEL